MGQMEEEIESGHASQSALLKATNSNGNGLKTPLLSSNGHYSYADDDQINVSMKNGSKRNLFDTTPTTASSSKGNLNNESMESMDGVPTLLSAFSEDGVSGAVDNDKVSAM